MATKPQKNTRAPVNVGIPTTIKVGAVEYTVHWDEEGWKNRPDDGRLDGEWASTHHDTLAIYIKPTLAPAQQRSTLLHEILHTLFAISGGDMRNAINAAVDGFDIEEYTVERLEPVMLRFLVDNPAVVAFIMIGEHAEPIPSAE